MPRLLLLTAFCFSVARDVAAEIYCEPEECYMVLGLESPLDTSTPPTESEIKKAYRQLSMVWHPDKCKEEGCEAKFVRIANAYTILSSRESREAYDYFLEHPEAYGHTARYYKAMLAPEVPLWIVVVGFIAVVSAIQWPLAWQQYYSAQHWAKQSNVYKARAAKMKRVAEDSAAGGDASDDGDDGIELELSGYPRPQISHLFVFKLPLIPLRLGYAGYRAFRHVVKYSVLGQPYDADAQLYITQETLRISSSRWAEMPAETQAEFLAARVWTKKGMAELQRTHRMAYNQKRKRK